MPSPDDWEKLIELTAGDMFERAHALLAGCAHVDQALKARYSGDSFGERVTAACASQPSIDRDRLRVAWELRTRIAHDATIASNRRISDVIVPLARAHLLLTKQLTPDVEASLATLDGIDISVAAATGDFEISLIDAPGVLNGPVHSSNPVEWGVAIVLAAAVVDTHVRARGAHDSTFNPKAKFKPKIEYAIAKWLKRAIGELGGAIHVRNDYAHEARLPAISTQPQVLAFMRLAWELAAQTDRLNDAKEAQVSAPPPSRPTRPTYSPSLSKSVAGGVMAVLGCGAAVLCVASGGGRSSSGTHRVERSDWPGSLTVPPPEPSSPPAPPLSPILVVVDSVPDGFETRKRLVDGMDATDWCTDGGWSGDQYYMMFKTPPGRRIRRIEVVQSERSPARIRQLTLDVGARIVRSVQLRREDRAIVLDGLDITDYSVQLMAQEVWPGASPRQRTLCIAEVRFFADG